MTRQQIKYMVEPSALVYRCMKVSKEDCAMTVWLAQCLCPDRHAILATAGEAADADAARDLVDHLRRVVEQFTADGLLNPWCGLCHAPSDRWSYELKRTRFSTLTTAEPALAAAEAEQIATGLVLGELGGTADRIKH